MDSEKISRPGLFGLDYSNRDFTKADSWGKNQFNSSFPTSFACYMDFRKIKPVYLRLDDRLQVTHSTIEAKELFGLKPLSPNLYFAFETVYSAHAPHAIGSVPRTDLVTFDQSKKPAQLLKALEIKLTALPDNTTCALNEESYGCEIVVRPDTIVYLALGIAEIYKDEKKSLLKTLAPTCNGIKDWEEIAEIKPRIKDMTKALDNVFVSKLKNQTPFLM